MKEQSNPQASSASSKTQRIHTVTRADLPVHCPMPGADLMTMHPRVYLAVGKTGRGRCPYCGDEYVLR